MTEAIQIPQTTVAEWRSLIAKKSGCDEQAVDDVLERFGIEVNSIAPRRKTILLRSVRLNGKKSGRVRVSCCTWLSLGLWPMTALRQ
jgi:hypothetical protein